MTEKFQQTEGARRRAWLVGGLAALLFAIGGCNVPRGQNLFEPQPRDGTIDATRVETRDDITAIYHFYKPDPWIRNADGDVTGFRVPVYFVSAQTEKGAFVPGTIMVWLYQVVRTPDGKTDRKFVHGWELDQQDAMGFRSRTRAVMGNFYGFFFQWPETLELGGKQIEIVFGYQRLDQRLITGPSRQFRVPLGSGIQRVTPAELPRPGAAQNEAQPAESP